MMEQEKWYNIHFKQGKQLDINEIGAIKFNVRDNKCANIDYIRTWDFLPNNIGAPLANEKALKLLEEIAPGEFQAIPTEIIMPDGYVIKEYKLINVINQVYTIDYDKSILEEERWRTEWNMYKTYLHHRNLPAGANLAVEELVFICSNNFQLALKKYGVSGLICNDSCGKHRFLEK